MPKEAPITDTEILWDISNMMNEGIEINIPRKTGIILFGTVIVANVATVMVLGAVVRWANKTVKKNKEKTEDSTLKDAD